MMEFPDNLVRSNVRALSPYSCARDEFKGHEGIFLDANENPFGKLNRYPDPYQTELKSAVSAVKRVPAENIFLGNGSDEIIDLCFRIFCEPGIDRVLTFAPTYGMYQVSASANNIEMISIPLNENFDIEFSDAEPHLDDKKLKLIIICSPNNPTGNAVNRAVLETIINRFRGIILLDEAYIDFAVDPSMSGFIFKYPNLIVMQTFSKAWGMASVRIGMAFASEAIIGYFNKMKPPYNISTINQQTVLEKIRKGLPVVRKEITKIVKERERIAEKLRKIHCIVKVYHSDANFLLVKTVDANKLYGLLVNDGIVVRNRSSMAENCIRITIGKRSENNKLLKALENIKI
jgi:histidinol-phosphate aminotransferase